MLRRKKIKCMHNPSCHLSLHTNWIKKHNPRTRNILCPSCSRNLPRLRVRIHLTKNDKDSLLYIAVTWTDKTVIGQNGNLVQGFFHSHPTRIEELRGKYREKKKNNVEAVAFTGHIIEICCTYLNARITFPKTQAIRGLVARVLDGQKTQVLRGLVHLVRYGPKDTLADRDCIRALSIR